VSFSQLLWAIAPLMVNFALSRSFRAPTDIKSIEFMEVEAIKAAVRAQRKTPIP
jgi:hypothetical protein